MNCDTVLLCLCMYREGEFSAALGDTLRCGRKATIGDADKG